MSSVFFSIDISCWIWLVAGVFSIIIITTTTDNGSVSDILDSTFLLLFTTHFLLSYMLRFCHMSYDLCVVSGNDNNGYF